MGKSIFGCCWSNYSPTPPASQDVDPLNQMGTVVCCWSNYILFKNLIRLAGAQGGMTQGFGVNRLGMALKEITSWMVLVGFRHHFLPFPSVSLILLKVSRCYRGYPKNFWCYQRLVVVSPLPAISQSLAIEPSRWSRTCHLPWKKDPPTTMHQGFRIRKKGSLGIEQRARTKHAPPGSSGCPPTLLGVSDT